MSGTGDSVCMYRTGAVVMYVSTKLRIGRSGVRILSFPRQRGVDCSVQPATCTIATGDGLLRDKAASSVKLTVHLHLMLSLRVSGAVRLVSRYAFLESRRTTRVCVVYLTFTCALGLKDEVRNLQTPLIEFPTAATPCFVYLNFSCSSHVPF